MMPLTRTQAKALKVGDRVSLVSTWRFCGDTDEDPGLRAAFPGAIPAGKVVQEFDSSDDSILVEWDNFNRQALWTDYDALDAEVPPPTESEIAEAIRSITGH